MTTITVFGVFYLLTIIFRILIFICATQTILFQKMIRNLQYDTI